MYRTSRKTAPRVKNGRVQLKNRSAPTPTCYNTPQPCPVIDKERPGWGYRHVVRKEHIRRFIPLIPHWNDLSRDLDVILIGKGREDCFGWHRPYVVAICAWEWEIVETWSDEFYQEHAALLAKLHIPSYPDTWGGNWEWVCDWKVLFSEATARAFSLVHVLIHELGHHHDRITTRSKRRSARGESYAEAYARRYEDVLVERYLREFSAE